MNDIWKIINILKELNTTGMVAKALIINKANENEVKKAIIPIIENSIKKLNEIITAKEQ